MVNIVEKDKANNTSKTISGKANATIYTGEIIFENSKQFKLHTSDIVFKKSDYDIIRIK